MLPSGRDEKERAYELLKEAYHQQMNGKLAEAESLYKRSIRIYPTAEAYTFLGWTYSFMGLLEQAIQECKRAIEVDPDFGNPYNDIGAYLIELGELDDAVPWLKKATFARRYDPMHFPYFNLGRVYEAKGDLGESIRCYQKSLEYDPEFSNALHALSRVKARLN